MVSPPGRVSFDPRDFLDLAEALVARSDATEADLRTAISRAYYALHLRARQRLIERGRMQSTGTGLDHQIVIESLRAGGGSQGDQGDAVRTERNIADYDIETEVIPATARRVVNLAKHVFPRL